MRFALDAEGSDHYRDDLDIIPAINASQRWIVSVINAALGRNKFGEEIFRDLTKARVFQASDDSRVGLNIFPNEVWTILAVFPKPVTGNTGGTASTPSGKNEAIYRGDLYHIRGIGKSADRLSVEQWENNRGNPFAAGYDGAVFCEELQDYAYLDPIDHNWNDDEVDSKDEIEIRPAIPQELVTIVYVKKPTPIAALSENIEFPDEIFQMIFNKALQYIAYKQGDQTNIFSVTNADIQTLISTIT